MLYLLNATLKAVVLICIEYKILSFHVQYNNHQEGVDVNYKVMLCPCPKVEKFRPK